MSDPLDEARLALQKARAALRNGQLNQARQWAEQAAALAPQMEDPWLVLAAVASPPASLAYVQKALKINPESAPARRAMEWALQRLRQPERPGLTPDEYCIRPSGSRRPAVARRSDGWTAAVASTSAGSLLKPLLTCLLLGPGLLVLASSRLVNRSMPAVASAASALPSSMSAPTQPPLWAPVLIPKPTYTPEAPSPQGFVGAGGGRALQVAGSVGVSHSSFFPS